MSRVEKHQQYRDEIKNYLYAIKKIESEEKKINEFKKKINHIDPMILKNIKVDYKFLEPIYHLEQNQQINTLDKIFNNLKIDDINTLVNKLEKIDLVIKNNILEDTGRLKKN
jgi:Asp-tRNA(Asn)/Glu-tRNA(Gln) amidotransferase C subunit